jgi:23S rRNA pseudouridine955/2504/2580 synthase
MIPVLLENAEIVVVDKPAGLAAQPGEGVRDDVVAVLERQLGYRPFPVNRLDKETAGCMILAKSSQLPAGGRDSLRGGTGKALLCVVSGMPRREKVVIDAVLDGSKESRSAHLWNLREVWRFALVGAGRPRPAAA